MSPDRAGGGRWRARRWVHRDAWSVPPRTPPRRPRLPQQDTTGEAGYVAGTGPRRRASPGFSSVRAVVRLRRRAGMAGKPLCRQLRRCRSSR